VVVWILPLEVGTFTPVVITVIMMKMVAVTPLSVCRVYSIVGLDMSRELAFAILNMCSSKASLHNSSKEKKIGEHS
jgi:hypothetical protein